MTSPLCFGITRAKGAGQLLECVSFYHSIDRNNCSDTRH
uniref:Uncharacterized protein n=1 Tax=Myoviridae sp. ctLIM9 TaxID=2827678 RepID=A0A8S5T6A4_9CAUD|nr:MAG TPA: hypothetical protein [Myoviridae sp. ctLIM9]